MNENTPLAIDILRDTLRQIEENSSAETNDPVIDRLKDEFRRMILLLENSGNLESKNGKPQSRQSAFIP